jgi:hypothetical protein
MGKAEEVAAGRACWLPWVRGTRHARVDLDQAGCSQLVRHGVGAVPWRCKYPHAACIAFAINLEQPLTNIFGASQGVIVSLYLGNCLKQVRCRSASSTGASSLHSRLSDAVDGSTPGRTQPRRGGGPVRRLQRAADHSARRELLSPGSGGRPAASGHRLGD